MPEAFVNRARGVEVTREGASPRRTALVALLVCAGYYLTAKIGFAFALQPGSVSTLWLPNSILLAALLLVPRRSWWLVLLAACPAHLAAQLQSGVPTMMVLSWFVSNSVQALIGAVLITRLLGGRLRFDSFRDITIFLLFGAFLAPFLSSFLDIGLIKLNDWGSGPFWESWRIRFLSNVLATMTVVPVIVTWANGGLTAVRKATLKRRVEAVLLSAGLFVVGFVGFNVQQRIAERTPSLLYWPLPFLLWAAVRFGSRGASTSLLLVMFLAIYGATHGQGPFVANSPTDNALSIQWFLIVVSIPLMYLAAVIQERQRAEEAARRNEERLAMALDAAQMGTWDWHIAENISKWSDETKRLFGFSSDDPECSAEDFLDRIHPEDRPFVEQAIERAISEGSPYEAEFRVLKPDGSVRWVRGKGKVLHDEAGLPIRMVGLNADITARKQTEEALLESNERNQATLRALPDLMFLQNKEGVYLDYHTRDPSVLLMPPETFLGKNIHDVLPPDLAERFLDCFRRLNSTDETQVIEYSLEICGEERVYEARIVGTEGDKVVSIVRDVTEARRAAEAVRRGEEMLLQSNRQIRALAARLIDAQEAERRRISLQLHDDLSQNMATLGLALSRLKRKLPATREQTAAELDLLVQQTKELTEQLRRLSHQLHPQVLEHLGLVAALESQATEFGHEEQIDVRLSARVRSEKLPFDVSVCLYRVALEALRNVSKHSGAGSARISLAEDDDSLTLEVSDSGRGFDVETATRGSGLGLVSAGERVKLLQGTFEIRSKPDLGTTLVARIPLAR